MDLIAPSPSTADAPVFDAADLARLQALDPEGRTGLVPRVLAAFDAALREARAASTQAADAQDAGALRQAVHRLKSAANSVGARALAHAADGLERRSAEGVVDAALLAAFLDAVDAVADALVPLRAGLAR